MCVRYPEAGSGRASAQSFGVAGPDTAATASATIGRPPQSFGMHRDGRIAGAPSPLPSRENDDDVDAAPDSRCATRASGWAPRMTGDRGATLPVSGMLACLFREQGGEPPELADPLGLPFHDG